MKYRRAFAHVSGDPVQPVSLTGIPRVCENDCCHPLLFLCISFFKSYSTKIKIYIIVLFYRMILESVLIFSDTLGLAGACKREDGPYRTFETPNPDFWPKVGGAFISSRSDLGCIRTGG